MILLRWFRIRQLSLQRRGYVLLAALLLLTMCLVNPQATLPNRVFDWFIVLDITQSMNVRDYTLDDREMSRIEYAKKSIRKGLRALPCGSRVALGMFTERNTLNIVRPVEVCEHFAALDQTVSQIDWRMAWAADSFISHGLFSAIEQSGKLGKEVRVLFITDGNQAPPANPKYIPAFASKPGSVKGIILGSGKSTLSPIPKLDARNEISGYWEHDEALQYGSFGMAETLSVLAMEQGQHDRNAGHGPGSDVLATAHLSGMDEANLERLAKVTGLKYARLDNMQAVSDALTGRNMATFRPAPTDLRPWLSFPALLLILVFFMPPQLYAAIRQSLPFRRKL